MDRVPRRRRAAARRQGRRMARRAHSLTFADRAAEASAPPRERHSPPLVSAVARAFSVLERISREPSLSLEKLSRDVHLAKATAYRLLNTLRTLGYVRRDEQDRWAMTLKLFNTGSRALDHLDLYAAARPVAEELAEHLGETVHMGVLEGDAAVYILKIESKHTIRMFSRVGRRIPLHCTAIGKVLLAFAPPAERAATLRAMRLASHTPRTLTARVAVEADLDKVRRQGFALDDEEHEHGIRCIGAPVFGHTGEVLAALSASWPSFRFPADGFQAATEAVRVAAARISSILGHPEPA
ncbi:MAG TPA: IclR family transcriptional regulator C-terminal domain-containing protein [Anaeromyxobacter sp.]|nr:IclR family transcriptional regulator C-terminal domain-containing protein [Anaeromyxobacter sp.]